MPRIEIGNRYGRLVVNGQGKIVGRNRYWMCTCDCGNKKEIAYSSLSKGVSKSCGCLNSELASERRKTHGKTGTSIHNVWASMIQRCSDEQSPAFKNYGGRNISVCDRWMNFENFLSDMGDRPSGLSLERIDNDKGYSPENCRWATAKEQASNRRSNRVYEHNGESLTLMQWSERSGIPYFTIRNRIDLLGWNIEKAVTRKVRLK